MVPPADKPSYSARMLLLLAPRPGRLAYAARLALICAATTLAVEIYQLPEPALTTYVVFFLNKPDRVTSTILGFVMLLLFTIIIAFVFFTAFFVTDIPMWRVTTMALVSFFLLFLTSASKLRPVGGTVALIIAFALDELGTIQTGELATRGLLYVWGFVAVPGFVSLIVNLLIAPSPRSLVQRTLAMRLRCAAEILREPTVTARRELREALSEGTHEIETWIKLAGFEKTSPITQLADLRQAASSTVSILTLVDLIDREPEVDVPDEDRREIAATIEEIADILSSGALPAHVRPQEPRPKPELSARADVIRAEFYNALLCFAETPLPELPIKKESKAPSGFLLPDFFTNPEHVHYALRTTAAAMLCYVLYSLLDWPGIHTCFLTCYIVSLSTAAESVEKLMLRISGCIIGAGFGLLAIVYLVPLLTSIGTLMVVVGLGAFVSAWVAAGSPRISYAGFQIAFAFFLSVIQGSSPAFDLTIARDRTIGILIGNLVVYVLFTNVWPVSVAARVDPGIRALLRKLASLTEAPSRPERLKLLAETQSLAGAVAEDLDLAHYEPTALRPDTAWFNRHQEIIDEIRAIEAPLLLSIDESPHEAADFAERLTALAQSDEVHAVPVSPRQIAANEELPDHRDAGELYFGVIAAAHLSKLASIMGEGEARVGRGHASH
ncbi:MAG TPA: FUSC family protein [Methylocella sp.]|nr:FUSC family protein [Methylocella sp.]